MQHQIDTERFGPRGEAMADAVSACVHCGFCLPTCPTYQVLGEEMDSPRGRIVLMKNMLEGEVELADGLPYIDRCLGCLSCVTSCPSGVAYGELLTSFRAHGEKYRQRPALERWWRGLMLDLLARPRWMRLSSRLAPLGRLLLPFLPSVLSPALDLMPTKLPQASPLPLLTPAVGARKARVALLVGCAQEVLAPNITRAAVRAMSRRGVEVVVPASQSCCGALALHSGDDDRARRLGRQVLEAMPRDIDAVVTTAAGCGSGIQDYSLLFKGEAESERAQELAQNAVDISSLLVSLDPPPPPPLGSPRVAVYQDACHLAHAQQIRDAPRRLLTSIEGLELREPADWQLCCGSAGIYNLEQPEIAADLGKRKATTLLETGAELVISGNIGCRLQLERHLEHLESPLPVLHTIELLDLADRGEMP